MNSKIVLALVICVSSSFCFPLQIKSQGLEHNSLLSGHLVTQYTGDNGLISNNITSAIQDKSGFIWATTYNGIMRFDGIKVDVFDRGNIPFLTTDAFYKVYEDQEGTLWFASQGNGLVVYKNKNFFKIDSTEQVLPKSVRTLLIEPNGIIWAGSNNNGIFLIHNGIPKQLDLPQLNQVGILDLAKDTQNNLWIATDGKGLYKYDGKELTPIEGLLSKTINALGITKDNTIWVGTTNGLNYLSDGKIYKYDSLKNYEVNCITIGSDNKIWIGTEISLARIDYNKREFINVTEQEAHPLARVNSINFDRERNMWISTKRNGLIQIRESGIVNFTIGDGLSNSKVNVILEGPDHQFYIGSDGGKVDVYAHGRIKPMPIKNISPDAGIRDILIDRSGIFWIVSYKGLLKVDHNKERLFTEKDGLPATDLRRVIQDQNGTIWIASRSSGLFSINNDVVTRHYNKTSGLFSNYVLALEKDAHGNIYAGTHSGGLSIISPTGEIRHYSIEKDEAGILIFNIHIDEQGKIWIVSNIGLMHFDGNKFIPLSIAKIKKGETYFDWQEDKIGNVWITTNIGVFRMKKADVLSAVEGKIKIISTKLFDNNDGMSTKECTGATHSVVSSSGRIWVPTIGGISVFYPEKIKTNTTPLPVYITSLMVDNQERIGTGQVKIEPGKFRYIFQYTALSFISPAKINFQYKLEGVDKNWIDADVTRQAEYTNLHPGHYKFSVVATNSDGILSTQEAAVEFTVYPFFYQTTWFYWVAIVLFVSTLYFIYKWRITVVEKKNAELKKVNEELDRFVYSASHDLRAPLSSILGLINVARLDEPQKITDYLKKIEGSVQKLDGFIRDIIDFSRNARMEAEIEVIAFEEMIHELIDNLMYLDEKNKINRIVKVKCEGEFCTDKKRLIIILNNLISNSAKYFNPYAENPFLEVDVVADKQRAIITVKDNGIGIAPMHVNNIFKMFYRADEKSRGSGLGLYIVKETVEKIKGTISVVSEYGKGSTFTVIIPSLADTKIQKKETL